MKREQKDIDRKSNEAKASKRANQSSNMLDWILEEAQEQAGEACVGNCDAAPSCASSVRTGDQTTNTYDTDETSSAEMSSVASTSSSRTEEETKRRNLQQQARVLAYRDDEDSDESNVGETGTTSGGSHYFSSLNDMDYIDYAINRSKSILDEEIAFIEDLSISNIETGMMCGVANLSAGQKQEVEEKTTKTKKKWTLKRRTTDHQDHQEQEEDDLEPSSDVFKHADDFAELENLAKEQGRRKTFICFFIIFPMAIIAMSGLGVFLAMNWKDDNSSNSIGSSDISYDSENPIVRVNPSIDESFPSVDTVTPSTENVQQPPSTARPTEEDLGDNNEDHVWANEQEPSPTYRPTYRPTFRPTSQPTYRPTFRPTSQPTARLTARPTFRLTARPSSGTLLEEDVGDNNQDSVAASTVDDDILAKHLEAYEQWKQDNIFSDDYDVDNSIDLDIAVDAKIEPNANDRK